MKRFKVISLHFTKKCNLDCPMCYRKDQLSWYFRKPKPFKFFIDLVPYLVNYTDQIALGGGEPLLFPHFINAIADKCYENNILLNMTTNGYYSLSKNIQKKINLISISFDKYKYKNYNLNLYKKSVNKFKYIKYKGCNLLLSNDLLIQNKLEKIIGKLFKIVDYVYLLYPKNWKFIDVLKYKEEIIILTKLFPNLYVDNCLYNMIKENKYEHWHHPCHYGIDLISINEYGEVHGCSFDDSFPLLVLEKPEDIFEIENVKFRHRYSCPYIKFDKCEE